MINNIKKSELFLAARAVGGFTLIETLVAVVILMTAIAGPLTIASKGMQSTLVAKDQDSAMYLAQDAMEYVRFVRDTNRLSGGDWLTGAGATVPANARDLTPCETGSGCYVDSTERSLAAPAANDGTCTPINYDSTNNRFSCAAANGSTIVPSIFTRTVTIATPVGTNASEAQVTVVVSWCDQASACGITPRSVTVREDLFDWQ